jgi:NAD+ synthase (glutamine-hydrolysing)
MPRTIQLAIAQLRPRKGEYAANLGRLEEFLRRAAALSPRPHVLHLPETALTGYFVEGAVRELAMTAGALAEDLGEVYRRAVPRGEPMDLVVGFYESWEHRLYNSALYVTLGAGDPIVRHVHRKLFLPTYGLFDEERFVEKGHEVRAFETSWGKAAMLVCEDAWHSLTGTLAALDGAEVVFLCAAAPARGPLPDPDGTPGPANLGRWERLVRDLADEHGVYVSLAHLVGTEGGKTFAGGSAIVGPKGDVRGRAPLWDEAIVAVTADLADIGRARADMPLIADLETMMPHLVRTLERIEMRVPPTLAFDGAGERAEAPAASATAGSDLGPTDGDGRIAIVAAAGACTGPPPLDIDAALTTEWLARFLRDEVGARGFHKAILGVSGGVDSAVTAFLAVRALGAENVVGIRMPYRTSSPESLAHGMLVCETLGIESRTVDITAAVDGYLAQEPDADAGRRGNVMARMRMITLFDLSAKHRAIPLGTGNKTERLFGYFTWHADDSPPVNPLGDLYKTQVLALARHLGVPEAIVAKPPSADLVAGQTDEGDFGISYERADRILNWMLAGYTDGEMRRRGFDEREIELVRRRLEGTHWKRRLPTVAMISHSAIGESYLRPVDY